MATAQTLIDRSARLIGAVESGEPLTAQESADALIALNAMLESWQLEKLMVYAVQDKTYTLSPTDSTVTLGPASNITTRPDRIESVMVRDGNQDYGLTKMTRDEWLAIGDKTVSSDVPARWYYDAAYPVGTLNLYPTPSAANVLHVFMWTPFTAFSALSTTASLPPGYERAIAYNLALEIAPEFERSASDDVLRIARDSKAAIKRGNSTPIVAYSELSFASSRTSDIVAGE